MNKKQTWLGTPESDRLEFKSAQALKHRETIVRAVVGLLNHKGGNVIVGVNDQGLPEGNKDMQSQVDSLQSTLVDSIEPRPLSHVTVRVEQTPHGEVLNVKVARRREPWPVYAERRNGMYGFWVRSGATTRALSLDETKLRLRANTTPARLWQRWDAPLHDRNEPGTTLVLQAELVDDLKLAALQHVFAPERRRTLSRREMGWTVIGDYDTVERTQRRLQAGSVGARKWLTCDAKTRLIRFEGSSDFLRWRAPGSVKEPVIYPFPIVEGISSFFWLLREYANEAEPFEPINVQLGLWRPSGYRLGPYRPDAIAWQFPSNWAEAHDDTPIEKSVELSWDEIRVEEDRIAYGFATYVYEDFGYDDSQVPFWNDAEGRFEFDT